MSFDPDRGCGEDKEKLLKEKIRKCGQSEGAK